MAQISETTQVGRKIREIRRRRQLSITELSAQAGVSKSLISQIELGTTNPSVTVLRSIANVLDVPLFTLFIEDDVGEALVRRGERRRLLVPGSGVVRELLVPDVHRRLIVLSARFRPGDESSHEPSIHQGEECTVVIEGSIQIEYNGRLLSLDEGDSFYFDSKVPHFFRNVSAAEAEILVAIVSPNPI